MRFLEMEKGRSGGRGDKGETKATYRKLYGEIKDRGNYLIVPRHLAARLGTRGAVVLMAVLGASQSNAGPDGWLWATPEFLQNASGLSGELQDQILSRL